MQGAYARLGTRVWEYQPVTIVTNSCSGDNGLHLYRFTATRLGLLAIWTDVEVPSTGEIRLVADAEDSGIRGATQLLLRPDGSAVFMSAGVVATSKGTAACAMHTIGTWRPMS